MPPKGLLPEQTKICLHLHCADGFATPRLARMLHSLVRVSRRVGCSHLDTNNCSTRRDHSPHRADIRQRTLQAVPGAVPKRKEAARPRRACTASVKVHNSPQSPPDCQTDGCKFHLEEEATCPTALVSQRQLLLASSPQECRAVDRPSNRRRLTASASQQADPTLPEPERELLQLHSLPS